MDLTYLTARIDATTVEDLRARGSMKWTRYPDALGAWVAEMDFGLAPPVAAALHRATDLGHAGYLRPADRDALAAATAAWCAERYGWGVPAERVHPLPDVLAGLELMVRHVVADGPVIVPTPAYMPFLSLLPTLGREVVEVPAVTDAQGRPALDLAGIARAFEQGASLLVLCNPWNPLGRVLDRAELVALAEVVDRAGGRVFADEIHAPVVFGGRMHVPYASVSDAAAAHAMTALSASKAFDLPGLKCAQLVITNDADAAVFDEVGFWSVRGASAFGIAASTAAYTDGGPWLDEVLTYLDGNRRRLGELLAEHLPEVGYVAPEGTYIAWLDARPLGLDEPPAEFLLREAGVALTDGRACGVAGEGHLRLVFATPRPILERMVLQMADGVRRHRERRAA